MKPKIVVAAPASPHVAEKRRRRRRGYIALALTFLFPICALAHPARLASAIAKIDRDGNVNVAVNIDLLAFILNDTPQRVSDADMNALLNAPADQLGTQLADAKDRLLRGSRLKDGE